MNQEHQQPQYVFPQSGNIRPKDSAKYLSIGISTFYLYIKQGRIKPPTKHGARISVHSAEYIRELAENGIGEIA